MQPQSLGYGEPFASAFASGHEQQLPARVISAQREHYTICCEAGTLPAAISGRLRHAAALGQLPVVGDWVAARLDDSAQRAIIQRVLPRRSLLARKRPGPTSDLQLIAANLDYVFVVSALNQDFSPRRLERALALIWEAGTQPVVLLTKLDACPDPERYLEQARAVALGVPVHAISVHSGAGLEALQQYLQPARTVALIGSSGVGKSTLLNFCLGEQRAATFEARAEDDKGRHTTTARELFLLPQGAMIIDTPGMRELGLTEADTGLDTTFADIEALTTACRFTDCEHTGEPNCAIQSALESGELDPNRYAAYTKLQRALAYELRRRDERARQQHQSQQRQLSRALRKHYKNS